MNLFEYTTGIVALISFAMQLTDIFSKYAEAKKIITVLLLGIFIGSIAGPFFKSPPVFDVKIDGFHLLLGSLLLFCIILVLMASITKEEARRGEMWLAASVSAAVFLGILVFGSLAIYGPARLSESELVALAAYEEGKSNYARALNFLNEAKNGALHRELQAAIQDRINALKKKQLEILGNP